MDTHKNTQTKSNSNNIRKNKTKKKRKNKMNHKSKLIMYHLYLRINNHPSRVDISILLKSLNGKKWLMTSQNQKCITWPTIWISRWSSMMMTQKRTWKSSLKSQLQDNSTSPTLQLPPRHPKPTSSHLISNPWTSVSLIPVTSEIKYSNYKDNSTVTKLYTSTNSNTPNNTSR